MFRSWFLEPLELCWQAYHSFFIWAIAYSSHLSHLTASEVLLLHPSTHPLIHPFFFIHSTNPNWALTMFQVFYWVPWMRWQGKSQTRSFPSWNWFQSLTIIPSAVPGPASAGDLKEDSISSPVPAQLSQILLACACICMGDLWKNIQILINSSYI